MISYCPGGYIIVSSPSLGKGILFLPLSSGRDVMFGPGVVIFSSGLLGCRSPTINRFIPIPRSPFSGAPMRFVLP